MEKKKFMNECIDCKYMGEDALWKVEINKGHIHTTKTYKVRAEFGPDPEFFDLDVISKNRFINKYKMTEDEAEAAIMNGSPICPKCESENYFSV